MTTETAVVPVEVRAVASVFGTDDPAAIVQRTQAIAHALADAIKHGHMSTEIQGREYVLAEGWAFLGSMLGVFPRTVRVDPMSVDPISGDIEGYEAHVELVTRDGSVVGGAVAECSRIERTWSDRAPYALKSMSQTRATGKAYRMAFGYVMRAAGYEATPAEEMPDERDDKRPQMGRGVSPGDKRNGVFPPPEHLENIGQLLQYARYHHGWGIAEVSGILGGRTTQDVRSFVEQDYGGNFDAAAATVTFKAGTPPGEATEVDAQPGQAVLA